MDEPEVARAELLSTLEEILGPSPLDMIRDRLAVQFGMDVSAPVMRTIRPIVEQMQATWRHEIRTDSRIQAKNEAINHLAKALDAKDTEIEGITRSLRRAGKALEAKSREITERGEALAQYQRATGEHQCVALDAKQRAERAEAILRDLVDPDPCYFDHNGYCQAHGYSPPCAHARARDHLAALAQPGDQAARGEG